VRYNSSTGSRRRRGVSVPRVSSGREGWRGTEHGPCEFHGKEKNSIVH